MRSYTSHTGTLSWVGDFARLLRGTRKQTREIEAHVARVLENVAAAAALVRQVGQIELADLDVLEIGVGQLPRQMAAFAVRNTVTGIDLDVIPVGFDPAAYWTMLRVNGAKRVLKTLARKAIGFDRAFRREMARQLGIPRLPECRIEQMDATKMSFPDESFDFVYSFDVFEHFPDPAPAFREAARVLRPGGVCLTSLHPITTEDGFHDLRIIAGDRESIPFWAHLRPAHRQEVTASAYLNAIRVDRWRRIIQETQPGSRIELTRRADHDRLRAELDRLRTAGELVDYSDEELLCDRLVAVWKKPGGPSAVHARN